MFLEKLTGSIIILWGIVILYGTFKKATICKNGQIVSGIVLTLGGIAVLASGIVDSLSQPVFSIVKTESNINALTKPAFIIVGAGVVMYVYNLICKNKIITAETQEKNKKEEFYRIWKWARTYMYMTEVENAGYFAWSCGTDGTRNADGPAPDGEEFFAMALFFASHRWGDGEGIFAYSEEAKKLLHTCIHKGENGEPGRAMWDSKNYLIRFITEVDFSDPSYHLPHFYELFAQWSFEEDRSFWKKAAKASRDYLKKACHPVTGLCAEYAEYDGTPYTKGQNIWGRHDWYYSDAYRTIANIALDHVWFGTDEWEVEEGKRFLEFFCETAGEEHQDGIFAIDGTVIPGKALHPVAMTAVNAQAGLMVQNEHALACVRKFWNTPLRTGSRRYYDNCLYFFAFLALSGNYRIY